VIAWALLAFLLPVLPTYAALRRFGRSDAPGRAVAAALAPALGLGVASCSYALLLLVTRSHANAVRLDAAVWLVAHLGFARTLMPAVRSEQDAPAVREWAPALVAAAAGCGALVTLAAIDVWLQWRMNPHGMWDAWAIWNLHARAFLRGAPDWNAVFSPLIGWSNPDYPPLVAVTIARFWAYAGRESTLVPALVAVLFATSSLALVIASVARLRGWTIGLLGGMALLMARTYAFQTACQCADVPIGFFILVAISFTVLALQAQNPDPLFVVAGLGAGLALLTKNEGAPLFILVIAFALLKVPRLRSLAGVVAGAALPLTVLAIFKLGLVPSNYLFELQTPDTQVSKVRDPARWSHVLSQIADRGPRWGEVWGGAIVCLAVAAALVAARDRASLQRSTSGLLLVAGLLVSYAAIYVATPLPLDWQIATSFDRLFTQLWPSLVWAAFQL